MLDIIEDWATEYKKIKICRIDGSTPQDRRRAQMAEFNEGGEEDGVCRLFLLSTRAGGLVSLFRSFALSFLRRVSLEELIFSPLLSLYFRESTSSLPTPSSSSTRTGILKPIFKPWIELIESDRRDPFSFSDSSPLVSTQASLVANSPVAHADSFFSPNRHHRGQDPATSWSEEEVGGFGHR